MTEHRPGWKKEVRWVRDDSRASEPPSVWPESLRRAARGGRSAWKIFTVLGFALLAVVFVLFVLPILGMMLLSLVA